ncbi:hypothetical protein AB6A40_000467 [Gnathostoma spinigerum]|uniref:C2H2-type domain-containing protein n=1 Tax=Gnathostoma spinigerum TaxID=75299 RepID=A0ABD6E293_9BILA
MREIIDEKVAPVVVAANRCMDDNGPIDNSVASTCISKLATLPTPSRSPKYTAKQNRGCLNETERQIRKRRRGDIVNPANTLDGLVARRIDDFGTTDSLVKRYLTENEAIESPSDDIEMKRIETDPDVSTRTCSICGYQGKWVSEMIRHKRVHTNERPFKCKYCSRTSKWKADLIRHVAKTHGIRVVSKYSRSKAFEASNAAVSDLKSTTSAKASNKRHLKEFASFSLPERNDHASCTTVRGNGDDSLFHNILPLAHRCVICLFEQESLAVLISHLRNVHDVSPYECRCCGKSFVDARNAIDHFGNNQRCSHSNMAVNVLPTVLTCSQGGRTVPMDAYNDFSSFQQMMLRLLSSSLFDTGSLLSLANTVLSSNTSENLQQSSHFDSEFGLPHHLVEVGDKMKDDTCPSHERKGSGSTQMDEHGEAPVINQISANTFKPLDYLGKVKEDLFSSRTLLRDVTGKNLFKDNTVVGILPSAAPHIDVLLSNLQNTNHVMSALLKQSMVPNDFDSALAILKQGFNYAGSAALPYQPATGTAISNSSLAALLLTPELSSFYTNLAAANSTSEAKNAFLHLSDLFMGSLPTTSFKPSYGVDSPNSSLGSQNVESFGAFRKYARNTSQDVMHTDDVHEMLDVRINSGSHQVPERPSGRSSIAHTEKLVGVI